MRWREIANITTSFIETLPRIFLEQRLLDSSYSVDEVRDVVKALHTVIQGTLRTETQNSLYSTVELLKQVFNEADNCGLKLTVDISSLENE